MKLLLDLVSAANRLDQLLLASPQSYDGLAVSVYGLVLHALSSGSLGRVLDQCGTVFRLFEE